MIQLTRSEKTYLATCLVVMTIGALVWTWVATWGSVSRQHIDPRWPTVVRTVDGKPTTPMPEDLDR